MISFDQKKICLRAMDHFGVEHQKRKAIEEMGELICELSREQDKRTDREHILEELADVIIMCEQLRMIYGGTETDAWIEKKLARLWRMMRLPEGRRPGHD